MDTNYQKLYFFDKETSELARDMSINGFLYDQYRAHEYINLLRDKEAEARTRVEAAVGRKLRSTIGGGISSKDLELACFKELRLPIYYRSKRTKKPALDINALRAYIASPNDTWQAFALAEIERRSARKVRKTYIENVMRDIGVDGRIHSTFKIYGAITGRWSSAGPNLQNLPSIKHDPTVMWNNDEAEGGIRSLYVAPAGYKIVNLDFCLAPVSRVLKTDLTWQPIGEISVGDELIGFDEHINHQTCQMRGSKVLAKKTLLKPCYRITTNRGAVIASEDHMWVQRRGKKWSINGSRGSAWTRTDELRPGDAIAHFIQPWETDTSYEAGWLAGMLDGEGWCSDGMVAIAQNEGPTLERFRTLCAKRSFDLGVKSTTEYQRKDGKRSSFKSLWCRNGDGLRMLGSLRPSRLLPKGRMLWEGKRPWGRSERYKPSIVEKVEFIGEQEVIAIQTETNTFIAEGMLSHNCQLEWRIAAYASGDTNMISACLNGDIHRVNAELIWGEAFLNASPEKQKKLRSLAKNFVFAICYGANSATVLANVLANGENATYEGIDASLRSLKGKLTTYFRWQDQRLRDAMIRGFTTTTLMYRQKYTGHEVNSIANEILNFAIQGGAAEVVNIKFNEVYKQVKRFKMRAKPLGAVHDALVSEVSDEDVKNYVDLVSEVCQTPVLFPETNLSASFPIEVKIDQRWS